MAKNKNTKPTPKETDSMYVLKLVLYLVLGSQLVRVTKGSSTFPLPVGLALGLLFTSRDRFRIDRKIEYALLIVAAFVAFWLPFGLEIAIR